MIGDIALALCREADRSVPASAVCAQKIRGLWYLYLNHDAAREEFLRIEHMINGKIINILSSNPFEDKNIDGPPLEKIIFKDIPFGDSNGGTLINDYLGDHPHIAVMSDIGYEKMRSKNNSNLPYHSGERFVYVQADFSPSLPGNTQMGEYNVRIYHKSQNVFCRRCNTKNMHKTSDIHI